MLQRLASRSLQFQHQLPTCSLPLRDFAFIRIQKRAPSGSLAGTDAHTLMGLWDQGDKLEARLQVLHWRRLPMKTA